ncbi:MAG: fibrobacter succinogenes major paralogous domain-containing protein [Bacteroidaceae bacterium]|nr:fibrobacter succinogenes major paralogous domain-containing protein [Bacteroidaceae bacterium]
MKKILFSLVALVCAMSMNAQIMKVMKGETIVATYTADQADNVVVEEADYNGHAYVELAGYKWATENVSGEVTEGTSTFTKAGHDDTYGDYYDYDNAIKAGKSWGGSWSLPSKEQWDALKDATKCKWEWKENYSFGGKTMNGYLVSDKNDENKSIFLPAAGFASISYVFDQNGESHYWSSTPYDDFDAYCLKGKDGVTPINSVLGMSVRPVVSMTGQVMKVMTGETVVATYTADQADNVVFTPTINGHEYVELAGYKWAKENVSGEGGEGEYAFTKAQHNDTYGDYYNYENAINAAKSWGGSWQLPTKEQWEALIEQCDWTWITKSDGQLAGYKVSDKTDSSKSIFLPAAGYVETFNNDYWWLDREGWYWSSTHNDDKFARLLNFTDRYQDVCSDYRINGMSVRPVSK